MTTSILQFKIWSFLLTTIDQKYSKRQNQTYITNGFGGFTLQVCIIAIWSQGVILNSGRSYTTFDTKIPVFIANSGRLLGTKWQKWLIYKNVSRIMKIVHSALSVWFHHQILTRNYCCWLRVGKRIRNLPFGPNLPCWWPKKTEEIISSYHLDRSNKLN